MTPEIYAYFLPQFYSTPENDRHWGTGFTEWTNIRNSSPKFSGHQHPIRPLNDVYYDLSKPKDAEQVIQQSSEMGLDGLVYWYYWFWKNKRTLTKVPEFHLRSTSIEQYFFFAWANADWTRSWVGKEKEIIFKQLYRVKDIEAHIDDLLPYFSDSRYLCLDGRPLYQVNAPDSADAIRYILEMNYAFEQRTGRQIHWVFPTLFTPKELETQLYCTRVGFPPEDVFIQTGTFKRRKILASLHPWRKPVVTSFEEYLEWFRKHIIQNKAYEHFCPTLLSGWDTTYRYGNSGNVVQGNILELLEAQWQVIRSELKSTQLPFILVKSYNEWAEGNVLEPYQVGGKEITPGVVIEQLKEGLST